MRWLHLRRSAIVGLMLALAITSDGVARAERRDGAVFLPVGAASNIPRTLYGLDSDLNGLTGYVVRFNRVVAQGADYRLTRTDGGGPLTDLDVWFYQDIDDPNSICRLPRSEPDGDGGETGEVTCDTRWAIVVLFAGMDAEFELDI